MVLPSEPVTSGNLSESFEVDDVKGANVILATLKVIPPVARFPKAEALHLGP